MKKIVSASSLYNARTPGYYGEQIMEMLDKLSGDQIMEFIDSYGWSEILGDGYDIRDTQDRVDSYLTTNSGYQLYTDLGRYIDKNVNASREICSSTSYSEDNSDDWRMVKTKSVLDSDGFQTDYTLYTDDNDQYICMLGDRDLYPPDPVYPDWEGETLARAEEWFDNYTGFDDADSEDDDTYTDDNDYDEDYDEDYDFDIEGATDPDSDMSDLSYAARLGDRIVGILGDEYDMKSQYTVNSEALIIEVFSDPEDDFAFYNYVQPLSDIQPAEGDLESDAEDMAIAVMEGLNEHGQSDINSANEKIKGEASMKKIIKATETTEDDAFNNNVEQAMLIAEKQLSKLYGAEVMLEQEGQAGFYSTSFWVDLDIEDDRLFDTTEDDYLTSIMIKDDALYGKSVKEMVQMFVNTWKPRS